MGKWEWEWEWELAGVPTSYSVDKKLIDKGGGGSGC